MELPYYLGRLRATEAHFADALRAVSERHSSNADVRDVARVLARWSRAHLEGLAPSVERYGARDLADGDRLRSALFHGLRAGGLGLLRDVHDLTTLAGDLRATWTAVYQAAMELHDEELQFLSTRAGEDVDRALAWLKTRIELTSPQALTVPPARGAELKASVPKEPTPAALPDGAWAPLAAGLLVLLVGVVAWLTGRPWLLPSLGPTAYLLAEMPAHPASRWYNVVVGHLAGVAAGFAAVALLRAADAPPVLISGTITGAQVAAAAVAIALTVLLALALRASHPPAAATTLLVALGSLSTVADVVHVLGGAVLFATLGVATRRVRLGQWPPRRATHAAERAGAPSPTATAAPDPKKAA